MRVDADALTRFTTELRVAKEQLESFEKLAEMSVMKSNLVEENVRRVELEAECLNRSYKEREEEAIRRDKIIDSFRT